MVLQWGNEKQARNSAVSDGGAVYVSKVSIVLSTVPEPGTLFHGTSLRAQCTFPKNAV